jgi:hypothetical protein
MVSPVAGLSTARRAIEAAETMLVPAPWRVALSHRVGHLIVPGRLTGKAAAVVAEAEQRRRERLTLLRRWCGSRRGRGAWGARRNEWQEQSCLQRRGRKCRRVVEAPSSVAAGSAVVLLKRRVVEASCC